MAIFDTRTQFAYETTAPTATGVSVVGDTIDIEVPRDIGQGQTVYWVIHTFAPFTSGTSGATVSFSLNTDSDDDVSDGNTLSSTKAFTVAELDDNFRFVQAIPMGVDYLRYVGMVQDVGVEVLTGGAVTSYLAMDPEGWKPYPEGQN